MLGYKFIVFFLLIWGYAAAQPASFELVSPRTQAVIVLEKEATEPIRLAVADLVNDVKKITGKTLEIAITKQPDKSALIIQTVPDGQPECYRLHTSGGNGYISGSDERGTIFGIYAFIEQFLGVDPMYFWNDRQPAKRNSLVFPAFNVVSQPPTFRYRGWFINDEDLLTEWYETSGRRNIDYPFYQQVTAPELMSKICETALRLKLNLIIPASFIDILNPDEAALVKEAEKRGLFLSMHHVEPMGVSAFTYFNYWQRKTGEKPVFSYYSNRKKLEEVWQVYAREWARYKNVIWQIGLRGIGDRPIWLADSSIPQSDADRGRLISEAMQYQMELIRAVDKRPFPQVTTTLWAEGSVLYNAGQLLIPDSVIIVFSDNSPGWRWQADFYNTIRKPRGHYGIYYHHQLWGSGPHLVQIVPPRQTRQVLQQAVDKGDTAYCIMNVSNIREFQLGLKASSEMLHDFRGFNNESFSRRWFDERYGAHSRAVQEVYDQYFFAFQLNSQSKTPALMDGQMVHTGFGILQELKLMLTEPARYNEFREKKKQETEEGKWVKTALADMHPEFNSTMELLENLRRQQTYMRKADSLAQMIMPELSPSQKYFFELNLLSHLQIITGLQNWLESVAQAKLAAEKNNRKEAGEWLQKALASFEHIKKGMQLNTAHEKWKHWYRGEKKMNLKLCKKLTEDILQLIN